MGIKLSQLILVILVSLVFLTIFPLNVYSDDWVYVESYKDFTEYYNSSSVKVDKQNKTIEV